jgi:hypothetical protein
MSFDNVQWIHLAQDVEQSVWDTETSQYKRWQTSTRLQGATPMARSRVCPDWLAGSSISNRLLAPGLLIALMMETASASETLTTSTRLPGATTQRTAIFIICVVHYETDIAPVLDVSTALLLEHESEKSGNRCCGKIRTKEHHEGV